MHHGTQVVEAVNKAGSHTDNLISLLHKILHEKSQTISTENSENPEIENENSNKSPEVIETSQPNESKKRRSRG